MKSKLAILQAVLILLLASCGSGKSEKEETKDTATTAVADTAATKIAPVTEPAFEPFKVALVQIKVKNFGKWKTGFQAGDSLRKAYGLTSLGISRLTSDSNTVLIAYKADDIAKAKQFGTLPQLKAMMQKNGVVGPRKVSYVDVRRDKPNNDVKDRLLVSHKVKDFDAWLKAYDAEGKDARASNGLVDIGIGRGVDDPNLVYVLFAVTDAAKAKARANSPELKKLMTDAGVVGKPELLFFKVVD